MLDETLWSDDGTGLVPEELGVGTVAPPGLAEVDSTTSRRPSGCSAGPDDGGPDRGGADQLRHGAARGRLLPGLREACTRSGTLLVMDETHTQFDLFGGAVSRYGMTPDIVTGGKGIGGGTRSAPTA